MTLHEDRTSSLAGLRILIVEDDPFLALELEQLVADHGAEVVGPVPTVRAAMAALEEVWPDAAVLDVNLRGERSAPVAAALRAAGTPFMLATGYGRDQLHEPELRDAPLVSKPIDPRRFTRALLSLLPTR